jgi:FkbM family methyltransferase
MNYYGFKVVDDPMYHRLLKNNVDYTIQDIDKMSTIIKEYIPEKKVALDIGCHYGFFTKFLSEQFKTVHAFDFPNDVFQCLQNNVKTFKMDNVTLYPFGLGEANKKVGTNDIFRRKQKGVVFTKRGRLGTHVVPVSNKKAIYEIKKLDDLNLENINLMMIDTEGYELYVLQGAVKTIKKFKPVLVLEFHNRLLTRKFGYRLSYLEQFVKDLGYKPIGFINQVDRVFVRK